MIEMFNEVEVRKSGVIYDSVLEQIKRMYLVDPEQAGELAIAAIELVLTGQISSDDVMIDMLLQPMAKMADVNMVKYDMKVEATRGKQIADQKLDEIAEMYLQKVPQRVIGEKLGLSQQIVSYRLSVIKSKYPELLQKDYKNTNTLQTDLQINYKNTKVTKDTNFVQNSQTTYKNTNNTNDTKNEGFCNFVSFVKDEKSDDLDDGGGEAAKNFIF
jgi:hypothetical protein